MYEARLVLAPPWSSATPSEIVQIILDVGAACRLGRGDIGQPVGELEIAVSGDKARTISV